MATEEGRRPGFTLIELIITLAILVVVLGMAYKILENCLRTEKWIERETVPEKAGEGIIALFRRDLEGVICKNLGTDRVFQLIDNGDGDSARDELQFYTTREPTALVDAGSQAGTADDPSRRTITPIHYFLKENNLGLFTLFRREVTTYESDPFISATGINFEIYDKVKSLSIYAFDDSQDDQGVQAGYSPWLPAWDSQQRYADADELEASGATGATGAATGSSTGVPRVTDSSKASAGQATGDETVIPPSPIPSAVRIEISILAGDERGLFKDPDGTVMAPLVFSTVIPILASQRFPLTPPDDTSTQGAGADPTGGAATGGAGTGTPGSSTSGGGKTPKVTPGGKSGR